MANQLSGPDLALILLIWHSLLNSHQKLSGDICPTTHSLSDITVLYKYASVCYGVKPIGNWYKRS